MSVVFTTISKDFIALCADKQRITATGQKKDDMTKIEKWSEAIAVGMGGDLSLGEYIRSTIHRYVADTGISNFGVQEIADLFVHSYHSAVNSQAVDASAVTKFIVAGKFMDKKLGAVVIRVAQGKADTELYMASKVPATLILEPRDVSAEQCNMHLAKALKSVEGKYLKNPLESIHRRAVRNVSEHSRFVSKDSDYLLIKA